MNFFFCESCGKRITDNDLAEGEGRDKKLKGVYCKTCAIGVSTMETLPMNDDQAKELLGQSEAPSPIQAPNAPISALKSRSRKTSAHRIPSAKREGSKGSTARPVKHKEFPTENKKTWIPIISGAITFLLIGMLGFAFSSNSSTRTRRVKKTIKKVDKKSALSHKSPKGQVTQALRRGQPGSSVLLSKVEDNVQRPASGQIDSVITKDVREPLESEVKTSKLNKGKVTSSQEQKAFEKLKLSAVTKESLENRIKWAQSFLTTFEKSKRKTEVQAWLRDWTMQSQDQVKAAKARNASRKVFFNHMDGFLVALGEGQREAYSQLATKAAGDESLGDWQKAAATLPVLVKLFANRIETQEAALKKIAGTYKELQTTLGSKKGNILTVDGLTLRVQPKYFINGKEKLGTIEALHWNQLKPRTQRKIYAAPAPSKPLDWIAKGMEALASGNLTEAEGALKASGEHPLREPLVAYVDRMRLARHEAKARVAWEQLESAGRLKLGEDKARALLVVFGRFEKTYVDTAFIRTNAKQIAMLKDQLEAAGKAFQRILEKKFSGKIEVLSPKARRVRITYDFIENKTHLKDFERPKGDGAIQDKAKGINLRWGGEIITLKAFQMKNFSIQLDWLSSNVGMHSYAQIWLDSLSFRGKFPMTDSKDNLLVKSGSETLVSLTSTLPLNFHLEMRTDQVNVSVLVDKKKILEAKIPDEKFGPGFSVGGGQLNIFISKMVVEGTLHPDWLKKYYTPEADKAANADQP